MCLERTPERKGDRGRAVAAGDSQPEWGRYPGEGELLVAEPGHEHGEQSAGRRLDGSPRRSARELRGDRE